MLCCKFVGHKFMRNAGEATISPLKRLLSCKNSSLGFEPAKNKGGD